MVSRLSAVSEKRISNPRSLERHFLQIDLAHLRRRGGVLGDLDDERVQKARFALRMDVDAVDRVEHQPLTRLRLAAR